MDPFGDDSDDDLFATSKPVPSKKTAKPSEKQPVKSSGVIFDDNQDDLFSSSKSSLKNEPKSGDSAESSKPSTVEDEVDTKPKKPAGAVSLFGGIDPFAAKSNLKKTGITSRFSCHFFVLFFLKKLSVISSKNYIFFPQKIIF